MFYVYRWYIKETNETIYIGKGSKKRYLSKQHNKTFIEFIKRFDCETEILEYFDDEQEAYKKEFELINEYKEKKECVCNKIPGGNGGGASINVKMKRWTTEEKEKYSKNNVMKSENQRKRMSINNPMRNKKIAKRVGEYHKKKYLIDNVQYNSLKEIAQKYERCKDTISKWILKGETIYGEKITRLSEKNSNGNNKTVQYKGNTYSSIREASIKLNITIPKIKKYIKQGFDEENNKFIIYDNQKPSQMKDDKSSLEGSTTNR